MSSKETANHLSLTGLLNVSKPAELTSRQVVNQIQKLLKPLKVGHAGTLDPMATGVLVLCVGNSTRLIRFVQDQPKEYRGEFILGKRSDTDDITGEVSETPDCPQVTHEQLESYLPQFRGKIQQVPPQFSAVHIEGRRAYDLARQGKEFEIQPRTVEVYEIELTRFEYPRFELRIVCGSGTYIRSIGRDLGELLGTGATMSALVRTRIGEFDLENALPLDDELTLDQISDQLRPPVQAVTSLPHYQCDPQEQRALTLGQKLKCKPKPFADLEPLCEIAALDQAGSLIAITEWDPAQELLSPRLVFQKRMNQAT